MPVGRMSRDHARHRLRRSAFLNYAARHCPLPRLTSLVAGSPRFSSFENDGHRGPPGKGCSSRVLELRGTRMTAPPTSTSAVGLPSVHAMMHLNSWPCNEYCSLLLYPLDAEVAAPDTHQLLAAASDDGVGHHRVRWHGNVKLGPHTNKHALAHTKGMCKRIIHRLCRQQSNVMRTEQCAAMTNAVVDE